MLATACDQKDGCESKTLGLFYIGDAVNPMMTTLI